MAGRVEERRVFAVTSGPDGDPPGAKKSPFTPASGVTSPRGVIAVTVLRVRVTPSSPTAGTTTSSSSQRVRSADTKCTAHGPRADQAKW